MELIRLRFPSFKLFDMILKSIEAIDDVIYLLPVEDDDMSGLLITQIDKPRVIMTNHYIDEKDLVAFDYDPDYIAKEPLDRVVPVLIKDLRRGLKVAKKDSVIELSYKEDGFVHLTVEGQYKSHSKIHPAGTSDWMFQKLPDIEFPSTIRIYGKLLRDMLSLAKVSTNEFVFMVTEDGLKFVFEGMNIEQEVTIPFDNDLILDVEAEPGAKGIYGVNYLMDIAKGIDAGDELLMEWGKDYPMRIMKKIGEHSKMEWLLAPRIDDEE